ncbi:MAG: methyltransferase domain-containing protein [Chitinophagales bacterium]|nr:methyltransferase domain-containing protein [Chitinophagales bacterium]
MVPQQKQEWFETWFDSPYYHLLYQNRNENEADQFVESLLSHLKLATESNVLDVACGTGRYSQSFAAHDFYVLGIDLSKKNILQASCNESEHLTFFRHDMRESFYVNYFDAAFNLFTSFGYFNNEKDNLKAIRALSNSLKIGGKLVIDFFNSKKVIAEIIQEQQVFREGIQFTIKKFLEENVIVKKILIIDGEKEFEFEERVQALQLQDFERYFTANNLQVKNIFGDYQLHSFDPLKSERMILIAEKI